MSKHSHYAREIKNGTVYTYCGQSFPEKGTKQWIVWGVCPRCDKIHKREKQASR